MRSALVFPGQGSQKIGMGSDLYSHFSAAKEVFCEVNDALGENFSNLIFNGTEEELSLTQNSQVAIMTVGIATLRTLEKEAGFDFAKQDIQFVAGHSLGEYTALCAAGAFSLAHAAKLLRARGTAMQEAAPSGIGGMISLIGLEMDAVENIAKEASDSQHFCDISNDNSFGQVVLSGHNEALAKATQLAKAAGAKLIVPLQVSAPFHCRLMAPAALKMQKVIEDTPFAAPKVPVISNITATATTDPQQIKKLLLEQITGRVKWRESVLYMHSQGVDNFLELGFGGFLTRMKKRIDPSLQGLSLGTVSELETFMKTL